MQTRVKQYLTVGLGSLIGAVGINAFYIPHHLLSGGVSGVAMLLYFFFGWPVGLMTAILNVPLFIAAYRLLDREYVIGALYGMLVFAVSLDTTRFLANYNIVDDVMLASIYGGVIGGIGSGITFRVNGSAGGIDIVAAIMKKYYSFNMGLVGFAINCIIMLFAAAFFGVKLAMYTLLAMYIGANVTDKVIEGFNRKKTVIIISEKSDELAAAIMKEVGRGVTFLNGEGAYTHNDKRVVFVVLTLTQIARIKFITEKIDPCAFMIVQDAAEVLGKGFSCKGNLK